MDIAKDLNDRQKEAVTSSARFLRIIAGAGSGKTRVLTYRLAHLVADEGVDPSRILAIAFTNKVAREMKERAGNLVQDTIGFLPNLQIFTFHSFCARLLRFEHEALGYPSSFTIFDEDDRSRLIKNCAVELGYKKGDDIVKQSARYIDRMKGRGKYPWDIRIAHESFSGERTCHKIFELYEERKTASFAFDFDDLILRAVRLLEEEPEIEKKWSRRYRHILVDEYQDTDDMQERLLSLLTGDDTSLYVVGDPDQTIYTWRGANQSIILDFDKRHPGAETIILNQNYRSTDTILGAANRLIAKNRKRVPKDLFTKAGAGAAIETTYQPTAEDEADWVCKRIQDIANSKKDAEGKPDYRSIAVLYRSSYLTRPFELCFKDRGIPYRLFGGVRFYERMEVKDVLAYCNLMANPKDDIAFERIANRPRRAVGDVSLDRLRQEAHEANKSEYEYLQEGKFEASDVPTRALAVLSKLIGQMERAKERLFGDTGEAYSSILREFLQEIGYMEFLRTEEDVEEDRIENVEALFSDIDSFLTRNPGASFLEYLQNVSLLVSGQDDMEEGNYVSLMTVHVAKGLEFDEVFVVGLNAGVFPSERALEDSRDPEEERRLAYVALTRARKRIFLSCNAGYSFQRGDNNTPSMFFKEAGITLPPSPYTEGYRMRRRKEDPTWKGTFSDGDHIDPFQRKPRPQKREEGPSLKEQMRSKEVWAVGDRLKHDRFGPGVVEKFVTPSIMIVDFENEGKKMIVTTATVIHKIPREGGDA